MLSVMLLVFTVQVCVVAELVKVCLSRMLAWITNDCDTVRSLTCNAIVKINVHVKIVQFFD